MVVDLRPAGGFVEIDGVSNTDGNSPVSPNPTTPKSFFLARYPGEGRGEGFP